MNFGTKLVRELKNNPCPCDSRLLWDNQGEQQLEGLPGGTTHEALTRKGLQVPSAGSGGSQLRELHCCTTAVNTAWEEVMRGRDLWLTLEQHLGYQRLCPWR